MPSNDLAFEGHVLSRVNRILASIGDSTVFRDYDEFQSHGPAFLIATYQLLTKQIIPDVQRTPLTPEDHISNAQTFLDYVHKDLKISLPEITAHLIYEGDAAVLLQCIEIIEFLQRKRLRSSDKERGPSPKPNTNQRIDFSDYNFGTKPSNSLSESSQNTLAKWNDLLKSCDLPTISSFQDLRENASTLLVLATEDGLHRRLPKIIRRPVLREDYIHNAEISLNAIHSKRNDADRAALVTAENVVDGDLTSLSLIASLLAKIRENPVQHEVVQAHSGRSSPETNQQMPKGKVVKDNCQIYHEMLLKDMDRDNAKREIEVELWRQHMLRVYTREVRYDQAWKYKLQMEVVKNSSLIKKLRNENRQYQAAKLFRQAMKIERDYVRDQYAAFKSRRKELEQRWENKKISMEQFFRDKYEMLSAGIITDRKRRQYEELQLRVALQKLEKSLKDERKKGIEALREKIYSRDVEGYIAPEQILDDLLKRRDNYSNRLTI